MATATPAAEVQLDGYRQGDRLWLPDTADVWVGAVLFDTSEDEDGVKTTTFQTEKGLFLKATLGKKPLTLRLEDEDGGQTTHTLASAVLPARPKEDEVARASGLHDLTKLMSLHEPAVLDFLQSRYREDEIYTWTGTVLVAVNPWRWLPLYTNDIIDSFSRGEKVDGASRPRAVTSLQASAASVAPSIARPHVFAVAATALREMQSLHACHESCDQSILVSGESGSGKTETCKMLLKYFARSTQRNVATLESTSSSSAGTAPAPSPRGRGAVVVRTASIARTSSGGRAHVAGGIEGSVLQTNPVLEAFGNASTPRNNNSSRFGKFTKLAFTSDGLLNGAAMDTYLLEKSRVVHQDAGNRNFHIFYQMCAGLDHAVLTSMGLSSRAPHVIYGEHEPTEADANEFRAVRTALDVTGTSKEEQAALWRVLAAVLHLGDIVFEEVATAEDGGCKVAAVSEACFKHAARNLGCDEEEVELSLRLALKSRTMQVGGETTQVALRKEQAEDNRDSLAKEMYGLIFGWVVKRMNTSFDCGQGSGSTSYIGLLDIFGFEFFEHGNSFEQVCINYANEKIQQVFNAHVFKAEIVEYNRERIEYKDIPFADNQHVIDVFEGLHGLFHVLDDQCKMPHSSDVDFQKEWADQTHRFQHKGAPKVVEARFVDHFVVEHFAAKVSYENKGFVQKNRDTVSAELIATVQKSEDLFTAKLFPRSALYRARQRTKGASRKATSRKLQTETVGTQFMTQLSSLLEQMGKTGPHFVRCINPNSAKQAGAFDNKYVVDQVRCNGLIEAVRVMRHAYGSRIEFARFISLYLVPEFGPLLRATPASRGKLKLIKANTHTLDFDGQRSACERLCEALGLIKLDEYQVGRSKVFLRTGVVWALGQRLHAVQDQHATLLQKRVRGRQAVAAYAKRKAAALVMETQIRRHIARQAVMAIRREKAALVIQRTFLRARQLNLFKTAVHLAAQKVRREKIAAERVLKQDWASVVIQKQIRQHQAQMTLFEASRAAVRIAAMRRGQLVRRRHRIDKVLNKLEEREQLLKDVVEVRKVCEEQAKHTISLEEQVSESRAQVNQANTARSSSEELVRQLRAELASEQNKTRHLTDETHSHKQRANHLEAKVQVQADALHGKGLSLSELEEHKLRLHAEVADMSEEIGELTSDLEKTEEEKAAESSKVVRLQAVVAQFEKLLGDCQARLQSELGMYKMLEHKNMRLQAQLEIKHVQERHTTIATTRTRKNQMGDHRASVAVARLASKSHVHMPKRFKIDKNDTEHSEDVVRGVLLDGCVVLEGWIDVRSKGETSWKRRWFVLKHAALLYFKTKACDNVKGLIWIEHVHAQQNKYTPEFSKDKKDQERAGRACLLLARGGKDKSVYLMPPDDFPDGMAIKLVEWHREISICVARADYVKKSEALGKDPDSRILDFSEQKPTHLDLSDLPLRLEAIICVATCAKLTGLLCSATICNAELADLELSQVARALIGCPTLKKLELQNNLITGLSCEHIEQIVREHPRLVELNISDNDLGDTGMERIGRAIQDKGGAPLTTLLTQRVGMSDKGLGVFMECVAQNETLTVLDISKNMFKDEGCTHIAAMICTNSTLTTLDCSACGIMNTGVATICEALRSSEVLKNLNLESNMITNVGTDSIAVMWNLNHTLVNLQLGDNLFSTGPHFSAFVGIAKGVGSTGTVMFPQLSLFRHQTVDGKGIGDRARHSITMDAQDKEGELLDRKFGSHRVKPKGPPKLEGGSW